MRDNLRKCFMPWRERSFSPWSRLRLSTLKGASISHQPWRIYPGQTQGVSSHRPRPRRQHVPPPVEANQASLASPVAQGGLSGWMNPTVGHLFFRADYRTTWFPDEPVRGQPTNLGYVEQDFSVLLPLWQCPTDEWAATVNVRSELYRTSAILPDTHQDFPDDLWNVRLGTSYRHLYDNGWIAGGSVSVGSASDQPFSTINEMVVTGTTFLRVPQGEHNAWLFSLNYSTNSEVLNGIPIPGVAYFYAPTDWFQATVGLPFANVLVRPTDDLTLQLSYSLLTTVHARVTYRVLPPLRVYVGFDMDNESYYLADRLDEQDRFFYYSDRALAGLQWRLAPQATLDLSGGYAFDRYYFEGRSLSDSNQNRVDVGNAPFVALRVEVRF